MKRLNELFDTDNDMKIYSIHSDSRYVKPYSIFFCIEGLSVDGHRYVEDAVFQGAKVIVHSKNLNYYHDKIIYFRVENTLVELNRVSNLFYDCPSNKMKIIGVTGSSGKTVVASMIKDAMAKYCSSGYIGTISLEYNGRKEECPYTTPEALYLQRKLFEMNRAGVKVVAMEASSHGLALGRVDGINFNIAVMTNIGAEHLDFHGTKEQYVLAKQKLFEMIKPTGWAILNSDDLNFMTLKNNTQGRILTYGIEIDFPEAEISLVSMYLSKNQKLDLEINSGFDLLDDQVFKILRETMYTIYQDYHKDFRNDDKLFVAIGLHLEPALERLANGQLVENPLKEKIIERHQEEFNYSKILNDVVRHDLNLSFDDDELAFIALHFVVANNRIDE